MSLCAAGCATRKLVSAEDAARIVAEKRAAQQLLPSNSRVEADFRPDGSWFWKVTVWRGPDPYGPAYGGKQQGFMIYYVNPTTGEFESIIFAD